MSDWLDYPISGLSREAASAHFGARGGSYGTSTLLSLPPLALTMPLARRRTPSEGLAVVEPRAFVVIERPRWTGSKSLKKISTSFQWISRPFLAAACVMLLTTANVIGARGEGVTVSDAWVPAADTVGRDVPLLAAIRNETSIPDALMRVRCPVANFSEKHIVDRGEGAPAMRSISSIPIPAGSTVVLKSNEYHVMLLQTRLPLAVGERFSCAIVFQKAGTIETEVEVRRSP